MGTCRSEQTFCGPGQQKAGAGLGRPESRAKRGTSRGGVLAGCTCRSRSCTVHGGGGGGGQGTVRRPRYKRTGSVAAAARQLGAHLGVPNHRSQLFAAMGELLPCNGAGGASVVVMWGAHGRLAHVAGSTQPRLALGAVTAAANLLPGTAQLGLRRRVDGRQSGAHDHRRP